MRYLVTAEEMRRYDQNTIERIGIPAMVLMERAALAALEAVERYLIKCDSDVMCGRRMTTLVMAGVGNNGGDGLALARLLCEKGFAVEVWCVGDQEKASGQWRQQREILRSYPVEISTKPKKREYTVVIDALFGVGLSREVSGPFAEAIQLFDQIGGYRLALDLPSGIDSDTGRVWGRAVRVDETVTFGFCKRGLVLYPGCEYAGEVTVADIGISERSFFEERPGMFACDQAWESLLPARPRDGNKGTFGKVLLAAGSCNMAGAAVLAAQAAYRIGAGMVKVLTPEDNRVILQETVPEALLGTYGDLSESLQWADVIAVGPGIGKGREAFECLCRLIRESDKPILVDADGLNLLAENGDLLQMLSEQGRAGRGIVLTPHVGELARLTKKSVAQLKEDLPGFGCELAERLHCVVAAKDARTFVCMENRPVCVNLTGNSGMATAGSGDVLAGIIAGLLAQGMESFQAAYTGAYLHGLAGDRVSGRVGEHACTAGEIAKEI